MAKTPAPKVNDDEEDDDVEGEIAPAAPSPLPPGFFNSAKRPPPADPEYLALVLKKPEYKGELPVGTQAPLLHANIQAQATEEDLARRRKEKVQAAVDAALK